MTQPRQNEQRQRRVESELGGPVGLWSGGLSSLGAGELADVAAELEELGYPALWFGEGCSREAFVNSALMLGSTSRLKVGTGIANIYGRDATAAKGASQGLAEAYPGRFVLGLGVSHKPALQMRGLASEFADSGSPLADMRRFLEALDEAPYYGPEPESSPPRLLAALGPKMLELSSDKSDGAHPYLTTPAHTEGARQILGEESLLVPEQAVVLTEDRGEALQQSREHLRMYLELPNYRKSWLREGFSEEDFAEGGSERLVEGLVAWGTEEQVLQRVREHLQAGADQVLVQVIAQDNASLRRDWRRLAPALLAA
ncbi:MAG: TIGR03620 family F420-dependent LLM class oxidoreductase [Rubrobacter sp.]|nr:TIGR03620 family F420-dependent LLM class oxidoreductase [Rubrobacter sp.]